MVALSSGLLGRVIISCKAVETEAGSTKDLKPAVAALPCVILLMASVPLIAQWERVPNKTPLTKDGKPDLTAATPLAPDGRPDLSGTWSLNANGFSENLGAYLKPGELPIQQWAQALTDERGVNGCARVPTARCLPPGIPLLAISAIVHPFKIVQQPSLLVILYEYFGEFRQIFLDGRKLPQDPNPAWLGYSVGRWTGNALVVDRAGFNGKIWLDTIGHPATDALHITERFERRDYGHLDMQLTIDDHQAYTKPWTVALRMHLLPDGELLEYVCNENEKDTKHVP
jgi:hypothetical protein